MIKKIKMILITFSKKHHWLMSLIRFFQFLLRRIVYLYFYVSNKVDNNMIIFESFMGKKYADSPKAIYEYLLKNKKYDNYTYIWCFSNVNKYKFLELNKNTKVIKYGTRQYYKYYSKSKYWITNSRVVDAIKKKKKQRYLQCWHGTPLKKLGYDIEVSGGNAMNTVKDIKRKYYVDAKKYDYMISPSKFCSEKFISSFNLKKLKKENIIIETGYPRNDFLLNYKDSDIRRIKKKLKLPTDKKIILYAPTWRDNQHDSSIGYIYKPEVNFSYLKKYLSNDYIILFRAHYFVSNTFDFNKYKKFIYDVSSYDDINDLYIISDILITDYSSVFFDYANLKRPIIFYMYDLDEYKNIIRDFYINLEELPGNIVYNEEGLIEEIIKTKKYSINERYKKFNDKYTYLDDGKSSERVVNFILEENNEKGSTHNKEKI